MLKKLYLLVSFTLFISFSYGQQLLPLDEEGYFREINEQIKTSKSEKNRLEHYLLLAEFYAPTDSVKSKEALTKVLSSPHKHLLSKGVIAYYQGIYETNQGSKSKAKQYYEEAIKELKEDKENVDVLIRSWYNYAYVQVEDMGYEVLLKILTEKCIPLSEKAGNKLYLAYANTQVGLTFMSVGQFDKAEEYHFKALEVLKELPEEETIHLITYFNLVSNYCYQANSTAAKIYLDKATQLLEHYPNSRQYPNYYYQLAMYHTTRQEYKPALVSLNKGIELSKQMKQPKLTQMLYFRVYNVYLMQSDYEGAKLILEQILKDNILSKEAVNRKITFTQLAAVNEVLGDYKEAYQWMKKSSVLGDSLQQQKLLEKMNELEIIHDTHDKEQTINQLIQEKKEDALMAKNRNMRMLFLAIGLVLSVIIAILAFRNYKNQQKLNQQINISHQQELINLENKRKYEASQAVLKGEEQERQRIAQDLHDSMGGMLVNIRMSISSTETSESSGLLAKIDKSIIEMRRISRNLMPETLKNLGLEIALKELCESMTYEKMSIQFEAFTISTTIPFQTQLALYRIAQEGLSNIIKYAQADNVIVQISQNEDLLTLTIEDDGVGFDTTKVVYGLGIKNMESRVQLINGTLSIDSQKGQGTTINVECNV
ncbi:tetratricopeptide repeat-containing sensor histidine kinase [Myroides odoratimimus]|uniref:tetratricopeptide repeat-containing sensor histidine kinase n=1 Tax=Myroides odoratimimus TaxID=76832 RepID=UPI002576F310|nr:ATP-binding protein [Myroides odoratimimus]MDM1499264.1 sensor histidine kinase [Myroides odoratimimus]